MRRAASVGIERCYAVEYPAPLGGSPSRGLYNDLPLVIGALFVFGLMLLPLVRCPGSFLSG